jgi:hypothetical protein
VSERQAKGEKQRVEQSTVEPAPAPDQELGEFPDPLIFGNVQGGGFPIGERKRSLPSPIGALVALHAKVKRLSKSEKKGKRKK